jgi:hypothetical protein
VSSLPCGTGAGDDESSGQSPVGAARAESDDDDDDMASDARRSEELEGNLMMTGVVGMRCGSVGF